MDSEQHVGMQEVYCRDCDGYFCVYLQVGRDRSVVLHCPTCDTRHPRIVMEGLICHRADVTERGVGCLRKAEHIHVLKSAWSRHPVTQAMVAHAQQRLRVG